MDTLRRLEIQRNRVALDFPFYGYHLLMMDLIVDNSIKTASTNGKYIKFNENFANSLTDILLQMVLLHEAKHVIFLHHIRRRGRDFEKWNEAGDYIINWSLKHEDRFPILDEMLYNPKHANNSVEQIYEELKKEAKNDDGQGESSRGTGESEDVGQNDRSDNNEGQQGVMRDEVGNGDKIDNKESGKKYQNIGEVEDFPGNSIEEEERIKELTNQAITYSESVGNMPANIKRKILEIYKPKIPWQRVLINWFDSKANDDYSWLKRDNRILDYYFPSLEDESLGTIGIAVDVSGSISQTLYNTFMTEINSLKRKYKFDTIIIAVNTQVTSVHRIRKNQKIDITLSGGGGTTFKPAFDFFNSERIIGMIYFTDMYSSDLFYLSKPRYDVVWLDYGNGTKPKFGKHIKME